MKVLVHRSIGADRPTRRRTTPVTSGVPACATRRAARWRTPAVPGLLAAAVLAVPAAAAASTSSAVASPVVGHVYLDDNTAGANTISAFDRHADGTLTAEQGSPFSAGGAGAGAGLASEGAIQVAAGGRLLLAVDAGSNQISVLRVEAGGSLRVTDVVSSGGVLPVSITVHGSLVYVANAGPAGTNYTGFRLSPLGALTPIAGSTVALPANAQPGDVLFNGTGTKLIGTRVGTSQIDSFIVGHDGRLTAAPGSPFTAQGVGPFGSQFRPTNPDQLFVSNAHNGTGLGTVSAFSDSPAGALTPIGDSPYADQQTAPCWLIISHDGRYLFAVNTGSGTISRYAIDPAGQLTLLGSTTVAATGGVGAVDPGLSPDGRFLYIDESRVDAVGAFAVSGGSLTELPSSPTALPAGATPAGIAVG
jgi:6-phosphogluconolactonase